MWIILIAVEAVFVVVVDVYVLVIIVVEVDILVAKIINILRSLTAVYWQKMKYVVLQATSNYT